MALIVCTAEQRYTVTGAFGEILVDDRGGHRSYYVPTPVSEHIKLALSLLGVDISAPQEGSINWTKAAGIGYGVGYAYNGEMLAIHMPMTLASGGSPRLKLEASLDEVFEIKDPNYWRKQ